MMRIVGVVQARLGSTRLPRKALADIHGKPMVIRVLDRVARARCLQDNLVPVIAAIPFGAENKDLFDTIAEHGYPTYSGPETDLIARLVDCARAVDTDAIVRITGDCPLIDWNAIDLCAEKFLVYGYHYFSNVCPRSYPDGLDVEVYSTELLEYLFYKTRKLREWREDFPTYLWRHEDNPKITRGNITRHPNIEEYRWTVDTREDLDWVRWVYDEMALDPRRRFFDMIDVLALLDEYPNKVRTDDDYVH